MARNNKEINKEINEESHPEMGCKVPAGKDRDENDTLTAKHEKATVRDAKADEGAALRAIHVQGGKGMDFMVQGDAEDLIHSDDKE